MMPGQLGREESDPRQILPSRLGCEPQCGGRLRRKRKKAFELAKEVKAIARERVGRIPAAKPIEPKAARKRPKHPKRNEEEFS